MSAFGDVLDEPADAIHIAQRVGKEQDPQGRRRYLTIQHRHARAGGCQSGQMERIANPLRKLRGFESHPALKKTRDGSLCFA
jgi:hypothetical protein